MSERPSELAGKRALVTGAASGIGREIATVFATLGARVMLTDITDDVSKVAAELGTEGQCCDVRVEADVARAVDATKRAFGGVDVIVNNAGVEGETGRLLAADEADVDLVFAVNVKGVLFGIKHGAPALAESGGGAIINIASISALRAAPLLGVYAAAKAAVVSLTQTAAIELRGRGIRVNAICPAFTATPRGEGALALLDGPDRSSDDVIRATQGRIATAGEMAEVVAFLASDRASFVSGAIIPVDNAMTTRVV